MDIREHLLVCLSEECSEVIKEISKILRFGLDDHPPGKDLKPNGERLNDEINDLFAVVEMLKDNGIEIEISPEKRLKKTMKVLHYTDYARTKGTLT